MMDKAERKALERKWDLLQQFYTQYANWNPSSKELLIPIKRFTIKDRTKSEIRTILDMLQSLGVFKYRELEEDYCFTGIRHDVLVKEYALTSTSYRGYNQKPTYDPKLNQISFRGRIISVPDNTNQAELCKILFKHKRTLTKKWENIDLYEMITGNKLQKETWHVVYNTARELNEKIASETQIKDLFIATKYKLWLNPKYF